MLTWRSRRAAGRLHWHLGQRQWDRVEGQVQSGGRATTFPDGGRDMCERGEAPGTPGPGLATDNMKFHGWRWGCGWNRWGDGSLEALCGGIELETPTYR